MANAKTLPSAVPTHWPDIGLMKGAFSFLPGLLSLAVRMTNY